MKFLKKSVLVVNALLLSAATFAAGPDLTPLTSTVDFGTVITAVLAIAGLLASVYVAIRGAKIVISMIRGA